MNQLPPPAAEADQALAALPPERVTEFFALCGAAPGPETTPEGRAWRAWWVAAGYVQKAGRQAAYSGDSVAEVAAAELAAENHLRRFLGLTPRSVGG